MTSMVPSNSQALGLNQRKVFISYIQKRKEKYPHRLWLSLLFSKITNVSIFCPTARVVKNALYTFS